MAIGRLPNLIVAGVPKSGTGSLFAYLSQHPDICPGDEKEIGYFNFYNPRRHSGPPPPLDVYRQHFAHCGDERYAFEATPTYSYGGQPVIDAIRTTLPSPKIILSLRDPVDRLWSAYTFQRELGNLTRLRSFEEYLEACERRRPDGSDLVPRDHMHGLYIGFYANYVPLWLDAFGPDIKVIFLDQLLRDPTPVMADVFRWLDIDESVASRMDLAPRNRTQHPRSTRVAKLAYTVKRSGDRLRILPAGVREPLRRVYSRVNAGRPPKQMTSDTRRRVEELYRSSNETTALALQAHGYQDLPAWLRTHLAESADQPADQRDAT
jgi:sulfotransferase family protein